MENAKTIIKDYKNLFERGYICFDNNKSAGTNLELLINKSGDCFNIPDYEDIEIKTIEYDKKYKDCTLFTCRADGPYVFPMKVISEKYGYPDKDYKKINVIKGDIYGNKINKIGLFYNFKLNIDYQNRKVFLTVYDYYQKYIADEAYWDFDSLLEKLERKYKYLAVFYYQKLIKNNKKYYWYNHLELYKIKNYKSFIELIEKGIIKMTLTCGVAKSGPYQGKFIDHGVEFKIGRNNFDKLFERIDWTKIK